MPSLLEDCKEIFHTDNLYDVIGVKKDASKNELKKGYYRKSLAFHPDRAPENEKSAATRKFQLIGQAYSILTDEERRRIYDETGEVDDELSTDQDKDWEQYWRLIFPKISTEDIQNFADNYRGSEEELEDLKAAYLSSEGDMDVILDSVLCCTQEDEERFAQILRPLIKSGSLPDFDNFSKENKKKKSARAKRAKQEAAEAEEAAKMLKLGEGQDSLMAAIAQRQASRARQADSFLAGLEAKYCSGAGSKGGKKGKR